MSDAAPNPAVALVGQTLGDAYRIEALIGEGAMGSVFRARDMRGAEVAVKILSPSRMGPEIAQRFLRESEIVRRLHHPHVVPTLDAGMAEEHGLLFLVMPLLRGGDLDLVLESLGTLEPETAVRITLQAASGLGAAHRVGIIHRDVKPGNLMLEEQGEELLVRVCDFGIAKRIGGEDSITRTGSQLGTPDYVSPEQLKSSKHVDERTDLYSLGATLYQMLCGVAPFAHVESAFDLFSAIVGEDAPHLQDRAPWIAPGLTLAVHKALQRRPEQRYPTLEDFVEALRPFAGGDAHLTRKRLRSVSNETRKAVATRADLRLAAGQPSLAPPALSTDDLGLIGQKLDGRYLVRRVLGKGGMGCVYEVEGPAAERLAAKVVSAGTHGVSGSVLQRFAREAKAASAISSPNVVRALDAGCDDRLGFPFIIMELLAGVDLSVVLKREGALAPEVSVRLLSQAARGVAAAHAQGVVHRDIKPANLFLQHDEKDGPVTVKVCDFGVAKRTGALGVSAVSLTASGGMLGSPMYMSPEQAKNAKAVDERTDVWSLSVVLWESLSGHRLWAGQTSLGDLIVAICTGPIQTLETVAPWVPRELARTVQRGLARDPAERTQSVIALLDELKPFTAGHERVSMRELTRLNAAQREELVQKGNLSASRKLASPHRAQRESPASQPTASLGSSSRSVRTPPEVTVSGAGKFTMAAVAVLSAAVAGGSAYYFARSQSGGSAVPVAASLTPFVSASVEVAPADVRVTSSQGPLAVANGRVQWRASAGETIELLLEHGAVSRKFEVSVGSDGRTSPSRIALTP